MVAASRYDHPNHPEAIRLLEDSLAAWGVSQRLALLLLVTSMPISAATTAVRTTLCIKGLLPTLLDTW